MLKKVLALLAVLVLAVVVIATYVSPWPSVLVIRAVFDRGAEQASTALAPYVPHDVRVTSGLVYDTTDRDARLDIYRGATSRSDRPTIVWFHGGGFVSGRRSDVANYLKILAGRGFTVVNVDYTIAPEATYPTPIRQANRALAYLDANGARLGINTNKLVLAGDSAGAQIAAQTAAVVTNPAYARALGIAPGTRPGRLAGALLYCGVYDVTSMRGGNALLRWFVRSTTWAYSGERDGRSKDRLASMSIAPQLTPAFPRTFISAGNADPLGPQSVAMADALTRHGVPVTPLFFPVDYQPPLPHEYQSALGTAAGRDALDRSVQWLASL
ncbi:alpha/beta hydrolase [Cognatilysobacter terrigena]|uniref:alpha/beta hydrolase n=1 Tax=Cognatilysobacter terrigena TaxID=2488749 RepID=UPI001061695B|nr:alpha/beta hydrolase [Lysobacter terrigena]